MYSILSDEKGAAAGGGGGGSKSSSGGAIRIYLLRNVGYIDRPSTISGGLMSSLGAGGGAGGKRGGMGGGDEQFSKFTNYKEEMMTIFDSGVSVEAPVFTKSGKRSSITHLPQVNALNEFNVEEVTGGKKNRPNICFCCCRCFCE